MPGMSVAQDIADLRTKLTVNEIFGPTIQGEGPSAGRRCAFLRLSGCNLTCSWCDTPYTWDWEGLNGIPFDQRAESHEMTVWEAHHKLTSLGVDLYVISGGEPMIQQQALGPLIHRLMAGGREVEIETNGTIIPKITPTRFNVSPKLSHSKVRDSKRIKPKALEGYVGKGIFKFVCQTENDLDEIHGIATLIGIPASDTWVMPEGRSPEELKRSLALVSDAAISRGWNITNRLHVQLWGNKRGV